MPIRVHTWYSVILVYAQYTRYTRYTRYTWYTRYARYACLEHCLSITDACQSHTSVYSWCTAGVQLVYLELSWHITRDGYGPWKHESHASPSTHVYTGTSITTDLAHIHHIWHPPCMACAWVLERVLWCGCGVVVWSVCQAACGTPTPGTSNHL
jgi:hypothetical protein